MDALSESEVGLIARHNLIPENLEIAQVRTSIIKPTMERN
jgi:hypothetical protein